MGLSTLLTSSDSSTSRELSRTSSAEVAAAVNETHPFVQHLRLDIGQPGGDVPGYKVRLFLQVFWLLSNTVQVRAKSGLAGCEYLSEVPAVKGGTVIMGVITDMLRQHGYSEWEWDNQSGSGSGSMIGASYDWRLMPQQLEKRDQFYTEMMKKVQQMVAADPENRPAVVVGFSLGCRVSKYFLHFCHARGGDEWMKANIAHFVPLGGPWLGAVQLMKAVMVDGSFAPLGVAN